MNTDRIWILFAKKKNGEATIEELAELESLLSENTTSGYRYEIMEKIWESDLKAEKLKPGENVWEAISANMHTPSKQTVTIFTALNKYAAAAIIIFFVAGLFFLTRNNVPQSKQQTPNVTQIATETTSKTKVQLPDGTQVWLNANSRLFYNTEDFNKNIREVTLTGEAFFDVTTAMLPGSDGKKIPFIIHAGDINITVKGTAFNVKAYPQQKIETTLIRGLIEITTKQDPQRKIIVQPNEKITLPSSEDLTKSKDSSRTESALYTISRLKKDKHEIVPETVWMKSTLQFDNETFEEIIPKMNAWFGVEIQLKDEALLQKRFTATIEKETLTQTLNALELSYPFRYTMSGTDVWISPK